MKISKLYTDILTCLGMSVNEDGAVLLPIIGGDDMQPLTINKKPVYVPTADNLRRGHEFSQGVQFFHPIGQSAVRKESEVMKRLRQIVAVRLHTNIVTVMEALMSAAATKFSGMSPTPEQLKLQAVLANHGAVNDKTVAALNSVLNSTAPHSGNRLVVIYPRKGANGDGFTEMAQVSFPIYEPYTGNKPKIFDVSVNTKTAYNIILALFEYIFPESRTEGHYSATTNDLQSPRFISVLTAFARLAEALNTCIFQNRNILPNHEAMMMELSWLPELGNLTAMRHEVPTQPGNDGEALDDAGSNPAPVDPSAAANIDPSAPQLGSPMGNNFKMPQLGNTMQVAAPDATQQVAKQPTVLGTALSQPSGGSAPTLGSPLTTALANKGQSNFTKPVGNSPTTARAAVDQNLVNLNMQQQLLKETMELAKSNQVNGMANGMMNPMQQMMQQMMQGMNGNAGMMNPQMQQMMQMMNQQNSNQSAMGNPAYQQLIQGLQAYPNVLGMISGNQQLNNILMASPAACQFLMSNPAAINNPQQLAQIAANDPNNVGMMQNMMPNTSGMNPQMLQMMQMGNMNPQMMQQMMQQMMGNVGKPSGRANAEQGLALKQQQEQMMKQMQRMMTGNMNMGNNMNMGMNWNNQNNWGNNNNQLAQMANAMTAVSMNNVGLGTTDQFKQSWS